MTAAKKAAAKPQATEPVAERDGFSSLVVTAPRVQVTVGSQVLQFSEGDVLPSGIAEESLRRLTDRGLVSESK